MDKRKVCSNCKHNDKKIADEMLYSNFCTLWECNVTHDYKCKFFEVKEEQK